MNKQRHIKTFLGLFVALIIYSCGQPISKNNRQSEMSVRQNNKVITGLKIEYGPNLGTTHTDISGNQLFYVHMTATITNDSTIPIHLHSTLAAEYEFPAFCDDVKYKVFLLPEELSPDTATIYNSIVNGQHDYLNTPLDNPSVYNKTLNPGEFCVITIGTLTPRPSNCAPVPRAIFSNDSLELYQGCDRNVNQTIGHLIAPNGSFNGNQFELGVKLELYKNRKFIPPEDQCTIISFGQISYPDQ